MKTVIEYEDWKVIQTPDGEQYQHCKICGYNCINFIGDHITKHNNNKRENNHGRRRE